MAAKIRFNDEIIVITGKYKGKRGKILKILSKGKAIVKGINILKKHQKPLQDKYQKGVLIYKEAGINISNIAIYNKFTKKADRVGFKIINGKKIRFLKSNGKYI